MLKLLQLTAFTLTAGFVESFDFWYDMISWKVVLIASAAAVIYLLRKKQLKSE